MRISSLRLDDCLVAGISFYLLFKLSSEIQAGSSLFPSVIAGFLFTQTSCLIFLYIRHVAQMVRAFVRIVYHVRDAVSKMFKVASKVS